MACPLSKQEIGNSTWHLLHSIAAHYPERPSEKQKSTYQDFFTTFAYVYPCRPCAKDFQDLIKIHPANLDSRVSLSIWLCQMHNIVNTKIKKAEFNCAIKELDLRWKKGPPDCYQTTTSEENIIY